MQNNTFLQFIKARDFEKNSSHIFSVVLLSCLAIALLVLVFIDTTLVQEKQDLTIQSNPFEQFHPAPYPLVTTTNTPDISAVSAIIMDANSHVFVYQKNPELRLSPASTTKMMTAIVALEYFKPNDILTVKGLIDTQGSGLGLTTGQTFTFQDLLKGALILSANDAAYTIAANYPGGVPSFVAAMNKKAKDLHLWNTHFGDPDGLDDSQDYTTAPDLVRLAATAMQNPLFASIVDIKTTTIYSQDGKLPYTFNNRNILLGYDGINGIKTGYTDEAGEVLATSVVIQGHTFYIIVMRSQDRFADTVKLLPLLHSVSYISLN